MPPFAFSVTDLAARTAGTWTLDPSSSIARFTVGNLVTKTVSGRLPISSAAVTVSADGSVSVLVEADASAIDTGHARRDHDLRKPGLLDLDAHPRMVFSADEVVATETGWRVPGRLTAKGSTHDLVLVASVIPEGEVLRVRATGRLDRRDYGVRAPRFMIGALVDLDIEARFTGPGSGDTGGGHDRRG